MFDKLRKLFRTKDYVPQEPDSKMVEYWHPVKANRPPTEKDTWIHLWIHGNKFHPEAIYCNVSEDPEKPQWICYTQDY